MRARAGEGEEEGGTMDVGRERGVMQSSSRDFPEGIYHYSLRRFVLFSPHAKQGMPHANSFSQALPISKSIVSICWSGWRESNA